MKGLGNQIAQLVLVTIVAASVCALIDLAAWQGAHLWPVFAGAVCALPAGVLAVSLLFRQSRAMAANDQLTVRAAANKRIGLIALLTFLRPGLSLALGGLVAGILVELRNPAFFLSLSVSFLAGLVLETWWAYGELSQQRGALRVPSALAGLGEVPSRPQAG